VKQPKQRRAFESASVASKACVTSNAASQTIPRVFWRQKKPLQFKMGDEVTARGTIASVASDGRGKVRVDFSSADGETGRAWLIPGELTLVRKARK
jgi:hypothetical protein